MQRDVSTGQSYVDDLIALAGGWGRRALMVLAAVSVAALVYYIWRGYIPEFHSDSAVKNLLAQEMVRQRAFFPSDWNYVNGDLLVVFGQIAIVPLLAFFKNGYALHAVSGTIFSIAVLLSLWLASGMAVTSKWIRLLVVTILCGGVSSLIAESLFGQVSYGVVLALSIATLGIAWKWLETESPRKRLAWLLLFLVINIVSFWSNPQRAAAYAGLPLLAAIGAWASVQGPLAHWMPGSLRWRPTRPFKQCALLLFLLCLAAAAGSLLHSTSISGVNNHDGAGAARWLTVDGFLSNAGHTLEGLLGLFGAIPPVNQSVISLSGIYYAVRLVGIIALLFAVPMCGVSLMRSSRPSVRMFTAFTLTNVCIFVFLQVTTTVPDMSGAIISARYMLPGFVLGIFIVAAYAEQKRFGSFGGCAAWFVLLVLASSIVSPLNPMSRMFYKYAQTGRQDIIAELERRGLQYGYASYWNAGALTVLSDSKVKIRQIKTERGLPIPFRHLASNYWYRGDAWKGETFLMLTPAEASEVSWPDVYSLAGAPKTEFEVGGMLVKVFPRNLAALLPGWDDTESGLTDLRVPVDEKSQRNTGDAVVAGDGFAVVSHKGQAGFLHYGPYLDIPSGTYLATFHVSAVGTVGKAGHVDVTAGSGEQVLGRAAIGAENSDTVSIEFSSVAPLKGLELRVFSDGNADVTLRSIELVKAGKIPALAAEKRVAR